jgi:hypothetical protein
MNASPGNMRLETAITNSPIGRARASWRSDLITIVLGLWLVAGVFVDGFAHNNLRGSLESFFTPWHAVLYSGFTVCATWIAWMIWREFRSGRRGFDAIPVGYEWGMAGVFVFGLGGLGDMIWHTVFGIEVGTSALLSPTHLMLLSGGVLILGSPARSAWLETGTGEARGVNPRAPGFLAFLPALLSVFAAYSFIAFMHMYLWGVTSVPAESGYVNWIGLHQGDWGTEQAHREAASGILFSNIIVIGTALLLLRRWKTPFGTFALLYGLNTLAMTAMLDGSPDWKRVIPSLLGGLFADALVRFWEPRPERLWAWRAFAGLVPLVFWGLHFVGLAIMGNGIGLKLEFWTGVTVMSALSGVLLSVLMSPAPVPSSQTEAQ